jgi:predicted RNase H-like HicB family nuclease
MPIVVKSAEARLTAIIEPADGAFVAFCPELDLATESDSPEAALADLIEMALDYSEQYSAEFERFSQSPNRSGHVRYIRALRENPTQEGARALFEP